MRFVDARRQVQLALHRLFHGDRYSIHGVTVCVPPAAGLELRYQLMRGRYENEEARAVRRYVPPGASVIELGGSLGVMSKIIRSQIGQGARHIIVEANPDLVGICAANAVDPMNQSETILINAAVAYGVEHVAFQFGHNAHVGRIGVETSGRSVRVTATTLSSLVSTLGGKPYCLVSDIEGAEFAVFLNERSVFAQLQYAIIEVHSEIFASQGNSMEEFRAMLEARDLAILEDSGQIFVIAGPAAR